MIDWIQDLFYRGVSPGEIEKMPYSRMKFWHDVHHSLYDPMIRDLEKMNA
jgi:hypothetical protein